MNIVSKFPTFLKPIVLLFLIGIFSNFAGCFGCPYSFSGASVPPHLKTIAIPFAEDRSGSGEPGLRELLTEKLTQKFIDDNNQLFEMYMIYNGKEVKNMELAFTRK